MVIIDHFQFLLNPSLKIIYRDNYGFVTFAYQSDAYEAVERGNDDKTQPRYDLCFGGRRKFCRQRYADLGEYQICCSRFHSSAHQLAILCQGCFTLGPDMPLHNSPAIFVLRLQMEWPAKVVQFIL